MAWMSPVKWRLMSSIGTTPCVAPPLAAPPFMPEDRARRVHGGRAWSLPMASMASARPTLVVVCPHRRGWGLMVVTRMSLPCFDALWMRRYLPWPYSGHRDRPRRQGPDRRRCRRWASFWLPVRSRCQTSYSASSLNKKGSFAHHDARLPRRSALKLLSFCTVVLTRSVSRSESVGSCFHSHCTPPEWHFCPHISSCFLPCNPSDRCGKAPYSASKNFIHWRTSHESSF